MSILAHSRPDTMRTPDRTGVHLNPCRELPPNLRLPPERPSEEARRAGDTGERMVHVAGRLISLVRDEGHVYEITAALRALKAGELEALAVTLAAMVDPDKTPRELLAWVTWDEHGNPMPPPVEPAQPTPAERWTQPCGTHAAFNRHIKRGERPCEACLAGEREYQNGRPRRVRGKRPTRA